MYTPDRWVIIKITNLETGDTHDRVFAGWYGGYTGSDSWKMNSGITKTEDKGDHILFHGSSGSVYKCYKQAYGMSGYMSSVLSFMIEDHKGHATIEIKEWV
jgi:hypothetical protein